MSRDASKALALVFVNQHERSGGEWEIAFDRWARARKRSACPHPEKVRAVVRAELIARGVLMPEPDDYFTEGVPSPTTR